MTVARIQFSPTYIQDEHQRYVDATARAVDNISHSQAYTEIRLGFVDVKSVTKGQTQQCVETIILVDGTGVNARYYWSTIPFAGNVMAFCIDCPATHQTPISVALVRQRGTASSTVSTLNVGANSPNAYANLGMSPVAIKAGDIFYGVITFPTAVSSTVFCGFVKMYIQTGN